MVGRFPVVLSLSLLLFISLALFPGPARGEGFAQWLAGFKGEAVARGIDSRIVSKALDGAAPRARVISKDRNQPEFTFSLNAYLKRLVSRKRVSKGRRMYVRYRPTLDRVTDRYPVDPEILVALWGIESDYGRLTGGFPVMGALATLAYDLRRREYFSAELLAALKLVNKGLVPLESLKGSWAGAMGPLQFMPSVFLDYGVDFNGDGRIDPWRSHGDLFASGANYLVDSGWKDGVGCVWPVSWRGGGRVAIPAAGERHDLAFWRLCGFVPADPWSAPRNVKTRIIAPEGEKGPLFAVSSNYDVLLKWNRSHSFALAVARLARTISR